MRLTLLLILADLLLFGQANPSGPPSEDKHKEVMRRLELKKTHELARIYVSNLDPRDFDLLHDHLVKGGLGVGDLTLVMGHLKTIGELVKGHRL